MTTNPKLLKPTIFWQLAEEISESLKWVLMTLSIVIPLVIWLLISSFARIESVFLPSPLAVIQALVNLWQQGFLIQDAVKLLII